MKYLMFFLLLLPVSAHAATLKADVVICLGQAQVDEAVEASERGDADWLGSIRGCFATRHAVEYERISCRLQTCRVRMWPTPDDSVVVYVPRRHLR
jgi:hypothetical protein